MTQRVEDEEFQARMDDILQQSETGPTVCPGCGEDELTTQEWAYHRVTFFRHAYCGFCEYGKCEKCDEGV